MSPKLALGGLSPALLGTGAPRLVHLFDMSIGLEPHPVPSPAANRIHFSVTDGEFAGERLRGRVLPGSGDWVVLGADNVARLDVRATLETTEGELIHLTNTGRAVLGAGDVAELGAGGALPADRFYARSAPLFETGAPDLAWLNGLVTVAVNELRLDRVGYRVFEVR